MLGEILCWIISIGLVFTKTISGIAMTDDYTRLLLALGFIFVGAIYRWTDVWREAHFNMKERDGVDCEKK